MRRYSYKAIVEQMDDIIAHPENYQELLTDMEIIGNRKTAKNVLEQLVNFVNNYQIESFLAEKFKNQLTLINTNHDYLEMRRGYAEADFYLTDDPYVKVEVKRIYHKHALDTALEDLRGWYNTPNNLKRFYLDSLYKATGRFVATHGADFILYVDVSHNKLYEYKIATDELKEYNLGWDNRPLFAVSLKKIV